MTRVGGPGERLEADPGAPGLLDVECGRGGQWGFPVDLLDAIGKAVISVRL